MNLTLRRISWTPNGIFGNLFNENGDIIAATLEHSYSDGPKIPSGEYECVRGQHKLENSFDSFETFEVTNVPNHSGILFHVGNYNKDSSGCILLGTRVEGAMLMESRIAFENFMNLQGSVNSFTLLVI